MILFFFQAEDGIRDIGVTGVQDVCSSDLDRDGAGHRGDLRSGDLRSGEVLGSRWLGGGAAAALLPGRLLGIGRRSEERRVGKECRSRWSRYHLKKKTRETSREQVKI